MLQNLYIHTPPHHHQIARAHPPYTSHLYKYINKLYVQHHHRHRCKSSLAGGQSGLTHGFALYSCGPICYIRPLSLSVHASSPRATLPSALCSFSFLSLARAALLLFTRRAAGRVEQSSRGPSFVRTGCCVLRRVRSAASPSAAACQFRGLERERERERSLPVYPRMCV